MINDDEFKAKVEAIIEKGAKNIAAILEREPTQKEKDEHAECVRAAFDWAMKAMPDVEVENLPGVLDSLAKLLREWFDSGRTSHEEKKKVYDEIEGMKCCVCGNNPKLAKVYCSNHIPKEVGVDPGSGPDRSVWIVMGVRQVDAVDSDYIDEIFDNEEAAQAHLARRKKEVEKSRRHSYYLDDWEVKKEAPLGPSKCKNCGARSDAFGVYETCTFNGPSHEWEPL